MRPSEQQHVQHPQLVAAHQVNNLYLSVIPCIVSQTNMMPDMHWGLLQAGKALLSPHSLTCSVLTLHTRTDQASITLAASRSCHQTPLLPLVRHRRQLRCPCFKSWHLTLALLRQWSGMDGVCPCCQKCRRVG